MRRAPQQARAQQRVDAILNAAEAAFGEVGYEAATTNAIAAQAGIPIGSLYQFFPNKGAILQAVAQRYATGFFAVFQAVLPDLSKSNINAIVNALIDALFAFGLKHAGFVGIALHASEGGAMWDLTQQFQQTVVERTATVIHQVAPDMSMNECRLHARISKSAIRAHCAIALAEHAAGNKAMAKRVIEQAKMMQSAYFTQLMREYKSR